MKIKKLILVALVLAIAGCAAKRKSRRETCPQTGASFIEWPITGFVTVHLKNFSEDFPYQIQIGDTIGTSKEYVLQNHLAIVFSKEKGRIQGLKRTVPAATLCCRWNSKKDYFLSDGRTRSVLWAYGKQAPIPGRYTQYINNKKAGKEIREFAYAVYKYHVIWPVSLPQADLKLKCFQMLLQQKDESGNIISKLVFVVGMEDSQIKSLLANNTAGITFELKDVAFDKYSGEWKDQDKVGGRNKVVYTFAWNAKGPAPKIISDTDTDSDVTPSADPRSNGGRREYDENGLPK